MVLATGPAEVLGVEDGARLRFGEDVKPEGAWAGRRLLFLDDKPAFELSLWCGTCPFLFQRLEGANEKLSLDDLQNRLTEDLHGLDTDVISAFAALLPRGSYIPMLLEVQPRLVFPVGDGDYFAEEQVATWGIDGFWGLPETPRTPYYRTFETSVDADAHLYEFVVPMVPPSWNELDRVEEHRARLQTTSRPTAVAVATLDVCQPEGSQGVDQYRHWCLTHFLLDGHHKMQAAAEARRPLQLLTLVSIDGSLATPTEVASVPRHRSHPNAPRSDPSMRNA